jgi:DNA-binding MarR family transcriptional regulator
MVNGHSVEPAKAGSNGKGLNRETNSAHVNGNATGNGQAKAMTTLLMSLVRDLFVVDDQASELPMRQLRVCAILHEGSRSMSSLGRELGVSLPAMTQIADRLERAGLVKRSFEGTDRRVRCLQLTPRAQRIMRFREDSRIERASTALNHLEPQQRDNVLAMLQALQTACSATFSNGNGSHSNGNGQNGHDAGGNNAANG